MRPTAPQPAPPQGPPRWKAPRTHLIRHWEQLSGREGSCTAESPKGFGSSDELCHRCHCYNIEKHHTAFQSLISGISGDSGCQKQPQEPLFPPVLSELLSPCTLQDAQPSQMVTELDLMMGQVSLPGGVCRKQAGEKEGRRGYESRAHCFH